jgi:hypothetical protein
MQFYLLPCIYTILSDRRIPLTVLTSLCRAACPTETAYGGWIGLGIVSPILS